MPFRGLSLRPAPKCPPNHGSDRHSDGESDCAHGSPLIARVRRKQKSRMVNDKQTVPRISTTSKSALTTSSSRSTPKVSGKKRKRLTAESSAELHPARPNDLLDRLGNRDATPEDSVVQKSRTSLRAKRSQCSEGSERSETITMRDGERIADCTEEDEDPENFIFELTHSLGLSDDLRTELTKVSHLPIEKKIIFLIASVKQNGLFDDVPKKAILQFDRIAENMLLTVTPETLFKDRGANNLKFYAHLKDHWKELGLKNGWSGSMTKLRSLELASQKSFSEGRRRIIEKLAESIEKELPLSGLAVLFGCLEPSEEECGMFAFLRCEFLKRGRCNFFDEVDQKLNIIRAMAPDDTIAQFRKFRKRDAKKFPEPTCKKRKCMQKPSSDVDDAKRKKRRKGASTKA